MTYSPDQRRAQLSADMRRMIAAASRVADNPASDHDWFYFLDALRFCIDTDLSDEINTALAELGADSEGQTRQDLFGIKPIRQIVTVLDRHAPVQVAA